MEFIDTGTEEDRQKKNSGAGIWSLIETVKRGKFPESETALLRTVHIKYT
jgi:hypothetical protein